MNGVVTTLANTRQALVILGHEVVVLGPDRFHTCRWPGYPDAGQAFLCGPKLRPLLQQFKPDAIHIVTEGPVGYAARRYCRQFRFHYTTSYLSRFPEYFKMRVGFPMWVTATYLRWFHSESAHVMVATQSLQEELSGKGFRRLRCWSRGVDIGLYRPRSKAFINLQRPVFLFAGRVAVEKNLPAFLKLDLPGSKIVIGDGPHRVELEKKFPHVHFKGYQQGETLAQFIAAADVFVFPSRTDTFGIVMLEALACGVPVAAFPVQGPQDVIKNPQVGVLSDDLQHAAMQALSLRPQLCRNYALQYSWRKCTQEFVHNLIPMR